MANLALVISLKSAQTRIGAASNVEGRGEFIEKIMGQI